MSSHPLETQQLKTHPGRTRNWEMPQLYVLSRSLSIYLMHYYLFVVCCFIWRVKEYQMKHD